MAHAANVDGAAVRRGLRLLCRVALLVQQLLFRRFLACRSVIDLRRVTAGIDFCVLIAFEMSAAHTAPASPSVASASPSLCSSVPSSANSSSVASSLSCIEFVRLSRCATKMRAASGLPRHN